MDTSLGFMGIQLYKRHGVRLLLPVFTFVYCTYGFPPSLHSVDQ